MTPAEIIQAWSDSAGAGWQRIPEVVQYATAAGLPLAVACTVLQKESNTRNVFGHDAVETGGRYVEGEPVTREKYLAYKEWRDEPHRRQNKLPSRMQGVGPMQLTWWSYQDAADARGGCHVWEVNLAYGFEVLAGHIKGFNGDLWQAAKAYNGKTEYADDFLVKHTSWVKRLSGATAPSLPPPSVEKPVSNRNSSSRNGSDIRLIAIHTNEGPNAPFVFPDRTAENLVAWAENNGVSYHVSVDDDSIVRQVTDDRASWSLRRGNPKSLNLCFMGYARMTRADWLQHEPMLRLGARQTADWCRRYGIPVRHLSIAQIRANEKGLIAHGDWTIADKPGDPKGSHTDPGNNFPWDVFIHYVVEALGGGSEENELNEVEKKQLAEIHGHLVATRWSGLPGSDKLNPGTGTVVEMGANTNWELRETVKPRTEEIDRKTDQVLDSLNAVLAGIGRLEERVAALEAAS